MKNLDRLISALYHAKSENREKMLSELILTVLYGANDFIDIQTITDYIKDFFHLEPLKYEVEQCLTQLVNNDQILFKENSYKVTEKTQEQIHEILVKGKDNLEKRFLGFNKTINEIFDKKIEKDEIQNFWEVFNEYILECFMIFGQKAIDIFLPYRREEPPQNNMILEAAYKNLKSESLKLIFKKLIIEYPNTLSEAELRHLNALASRAERFYSLGIEKAEYEKINNLQIKNLTIIADTNILYTILNLHVHQEKSAIMEIVRLAKQKIIDFKIVYLPKTYKEFQKAKYPLELAISRENFKNSQIKAMLASGNLDSLVKDYYENKLHNKDYPHPADNNT